MPIPMVYLVVASVGVFTGYILAKGGRKKVFISYYSKGNSNYKNLIIAWAKNNRFKLQLEDVSTDVKIKSKNINYLKKRMKEQIEKSDYFIVFIGKDTYKRKWVEWEIEQAKALGKSIIAVKEKRSHKSPKQLLRCNINWIYRFSEENIRNALDN
jgi:hypothetical protein